MELAMKLFKSRKTIKDTLVKNERKYRKAEVFMNKNVWVVMMIQSEQKEKNERWSI